MAADISKVSAIQLSFAPLIGAKLVSYQTAELLHQDGVWSPWPDLPIRISTDRGAMVSISWSKFDDLWLRNDESLPVHVDDATTRWVTNSHETMNVCLGCRIQGVLLGRGQMAIGEQEIEIWTRILIELEGRWLEVFNALDENGYDLHSTFPAGEFQHCL